MNEESGEVDLLLGDRIAEEDALDGDCFHQIRRLTCDHLEHILYHRSTPAAEMEIIALNAELAGSFELFSTVESDELAARSYALTRISKYLQTDLGACAGRQCCVRVCVCANTLIP